MKHSEILQLALDKHLALTESELDLDGKSRRICVALNLAATGQSEETIRNAYEIKAHIENCLYPYYSVISWLSSNKDINISEKHLTHDQVQLYRKRWVLHLIEEYKKQGK